jgi:hypothetical protein
LSNYKDSAPDGADASPLASRWLKPGADPVGDLIREREQDDKLDQADERQ